MASFGGMFKSVADFVGQFLGGTSSPKLPADTSQFDATAQAFLFGRQWLDNPGDHNIKAAIYLSEKEMLGLRFKDGKVAYYENVTLAEAVSYYQADSKGTWQWNVCLVRGKGNKGKSQKPWSYG